MNCVILAAGRGRRLGKAAEGKPKCLVEVGGQSILVHQLRALDRYGIDNYLIVVGYEFGLVIEEAKRLVGNRATFIYNPIYDITNTSFSLWLAIRDLSESLYFLNGDVLFSPEVISRLSASPYTSALALEAKECGDEEIKVVLDDKRVVQLNKTVRPELSVGEFIGVAKFDEELVRSLHHALDWVINEDHDYMAYFERGLEMILGSHFVGVEDISDLPTIEIDFPGDLSYAREVVLPQIQHLEPVV